MTNKITHADVITFDISIRKMLRHSLESIGVEPASCSREISKFQLTIMRHLLVGESWTRELEQKLVFETVRAMEALRGDRVALH